MALGSYQAVTTQKVAKEMGTCAEKKNISFVVNVGDNFYYCGIQNTSDPQIETDLLKPYAAESLQVPWYSALGNHEYGYNVEAQIQLSQAHPLWVMDARYYTRRIELGGGKDNMTLIVLDTNPCVSAYRSRDDTGWDPCGATFPTCAPVDEGPCKFHENIIGQSCKDQYTCGAASRPHDHRVRLAPFFFC